MQQILCLDLMSHRLTHFYDAEEEYRNDSKFIDNCLLDKYYSQCHAKFILIKASVRNCSFTEGEQNYHYYHHYHHHRG